jgi:hypothetical protein
MATDLSHLSPGLTPESQAATNTVSSNAAMTAPGTVSESTKGEQAGDPMASINDADHPGRTHLVHGETRGGEPGWDDVSGRRTPWGP